MTKKKSPEAKVDAFLASPAAKRHNGGPNCRTCTHPRRQDIDVMLQRFADKRQSGETTIPWRTFIQNAIINDPELSYTNKWRALLAHAENCLGISTQS